MWTRGRASPRSQSRSRRPRPGSSSTGRCCGLCALAARALRPLRTPQVSRRPVIPISIACCRSMSRTEFAGNRGHRDRHQTARRPRHCRWNDCRPGTGARRRAHGPCHAGKRRRDRTHRSAYAAAGRRRYRVRHARAGHEPLRTPPCFPGRRRVGNDGGGSGGARLPRTSSATPRCSNGQRTLAPGSSGSSSAWDSGRPSSTSTQLCSLASKLRRSPARSNTAASDGAANAGVGVRKVEDSSGSRSSNSTCESRRSDVEPRRVRGATLTGGFQSARATSAATTLRAVFAGPAGGTGRVVDPTRTST
jgi:hypothetical protein